ncbi:MULTISPECIES: phage adaptor protein [unclassified Marinobacter]|uniref:phage adaptor protein n=1 Tax=unclassified Marinobacter TaxID=83889 RepID=UPI0019278FD5|nr:MULTISPECIES: DUF6682 family protein [unclassified Marinobacter]MBL3825164.1 hypothetical protein [Marinobacter sp. MC3]MBL3893632.1 hypothetical protein [Marinobacter sp. MW3]
MTTAGEICSRASKTLFDETRVRWKEAELLEYLSDAQKEAVLLKPTAFTKNEAAKLQPGTVQSLPAGGVALVDIGGNMGPNGQTPGRGVTQIDRTVLESVRPDWRTETASVTAKHYLYDDRDPTRFEIYPPQPDPAGYVQISYGAEPPEVTAVGDELSLSAIYDTALYYLVLARAFTKSSGTQDFNKAIGFQRIAHELITGRKLTKQELHPEQMQERSKR